MNAILFGAMLNSALYLLMVGYAGMYTGHFMATKLSIVCLGVTYLSYLAQIQGMEWPRWLTGIVVVASIAIGLAAGLALLF